MSTHATLNQLGPRLGTNIMEPVAYDTAWVARVPRLGDPNTPAFPECLEWLRSHQHETGAWGSEFPAHAHGNTLSTLATLLALRAWNDPQDQPRIDKGLAALAAIAPQLELEPYETIGFEMLLPGLVQEAQKYGWSLPTDAYAKFTAAGREKMDLIQAFHKKFGTQKPVPWWFNLEYLGLGDAAANDGLVRSALEYLEAGVAPSIAGSPSATAYLLILFRRQGRDVPQAEAYLRDVAQKFQNGGIPNVCPLEEFEISYSLTYLLEAGVSPLSPQLGPALEALIKRWQARHGSLGYSSHFADPDPDDVAYGSLVLDKVDLNIDASKIFAHFFNGSHIVSFKGERNPALTANVNSLVALRNFPIDKPQVKEMIAQIATWVASVANLDGGPVFHDKWHSSPYYPTSRAIFAFEGLQGYEHIFQACLDWLLKTQHADGGWGYFGQSTMEETALAAFALSHCSRTGRHPSIPEATLARAQGFFGTERHRTTDKIPLWIGKCLYCPTVVVAVLDFVAQHGVAKALKLIDLRKQAALVDQGFRTVKFDLGELDVGTRGTLQQRGVLLCPLRESRGTNPHLQEIKGQTTVWAQGLQLGSDKMHKAEYLLAQSVAYPFVAENPQQLRLLTDLSLIYLTLDDILDEGWSNLEPTAVEHALASFSSALRGRDAAPHPASATFPKFEPIRQALRDIHQRIQPLVAVPSLASFNKAVELFFNQLLHEYRVRKEGKELDIKDYIQLRKVITGTEFFFELVLAFRGIELPESVRTHPTYTRIHHLALKSLVICNEITSFARDARQEEQLRENYICRKQSLLRLAEVQQAFDLAVRAFNRQNLNILVLEKKLPEAQPAITLLKEMIQGSLDWSLETQRYKAALSKPHQFTPATVLDLQL